MNYNDFINQPIFHQNNERGVVASFDEDYIVIKYPSNEKTYKPDVAFRTGFLRFENQELQNVIEKCLQDEDALAEEAKEKQEKTAREAMVWRNAVNEQYSELEAKNELLIFFFGEDFVYPPFDELIKKYNLQYRRHHRYY